MPTKTAQRMLLLTRQTYVCISIDEALCTKHVLYIIQYGIISDAVLILVHV